jgi:hypothetical protein
MVSISTKYYQIILAQGVLAQLVHLRFSSLQLPPFPLSSRSVERSHWESSFPVQVSEELSFQSWSTISR